MSGTIQASVVKDSASATNNLTLDTGGNATVGNTLVMGSSFLRNRLINGDMRIDQRNAGVATANTINGYTLDRWQVNQSVTGKLIAVQSSTIYPVGFSYSLGITSQSTYAVLATDYYAITQAVEGFNFADAAWGTASAKTVTLSFQVYSSLTGTFGGALRNSAVNRSYPFSYSIPTANTWTTISVTIAGDTSGTWVGGTNGIGVYVLFGLGVGANYVSTAGAWVAANALSCTGAVSVVGTSGATFYITGVQLEVGTVATPFERQLYSTQLAQCQRYLPAFSGLSHWFPWGIMSSATGGNFTVIYPVQLRTPPTGIIVSSVAHWYWTDVVGLNSAPDTITFSSSSTLGGLCAVTRAAGGATAGRSCTLYSISASALIYFTGCEL
jgi:hypothetical protein